ncbi:VWA domain-containing protein [Actinoplanes bogorensis]|uniref:VWA domain-containing protein n=1 Tax=Paractinoplanes bogorensis TaxID=1610840 RepID=A0ABS5YMW8_9ACTN|nr:VWA domain-containing protein [Actinoplanes bogorensis]MBU2664810.1 VWA domain-containing protein [Actinoplanes bogorensis]
MTVDFLRGGRALVSLFSVVVAGLLAYVLGEVALPSGDKCHGTSIIVWSSTEPGKARTDPPNGVVQRAAREYSCVTVVPISSGFAEQAIAGSANPAELPDVWLPTHSFWNAMLADETRYDESLGSFASSRMRLYVKSGSPLDSALGGSGSVTWNDLAKQATDGRLDLLKENALNSTSGAMATILAFEAAAGGGSGISADDVRAGRLDKLAAPIERSVASYPGEIVDYLNSFKPPVDVGSLPTALINEEAVAEGFPDLTRYYRGLDLAGPDPTLDHPFLVRPKLDHRKQELAEAFHKTLTSSKWQAEFDANGFEADAPHRLTPRNGPVVSAILERWRETLRKRISLAVTIDQSGSTEPYKREVAAAMTSALRSLSATDRVAFYGFPGAGGAAYEPLAPPEGFGDPTRIAVPDVPNRGGNSPVIEAVRDTADLVRDEVGANADNPRKQAVIVITDGEQAGAGSSAEQQRDIEGIRRYRDRGVQVFFILVGDKPLCSIDRIYSTLGSSCSGGSRPAKLDQDEQRWVYCISNRPDCPTPPPSSSGDRVRAIVKQIFDQLGGAPI